MIDTHLHLHLEQFDQDRQQAIERAEHTQIRRLVEVGYDLESSHAALELAEAHPAIYAAVGIQPHYATVAGNDWLAEIRRLAAHPKAVAIGEIGLDYYHDRAPHDAQERLFRAQLALARELKLPVVIHSREAQADTVRILHDAARGQPGIMHSFSGDWAYAQACLEVGFLLSFSGPVTFAKATELHEVARRTPLDQILTETDSPYLAPHPLRGKRNEPANVRLIAERLAALRELDLAELARAVWDNAERIFDFSRPL
ncbi:MAG TPA: TatD family hydrolase [Roseiflexaceae bacterium]|nr:TatD family hydrolase [Roseiflexaceae bacterium]